MPAINHIHTYVKYKSRPGWFRCTAPNCTHHIDKELLLGKLALCNECGAQMILSREDLKRVTPKCLNCSDTKKAKIFRKAQELTKDLGTHGFNPLGLDFSRNLETEERQGSFLDLEDERTEEELFASDPWGSLTSEEEEEGGEEDD